MLRDNASWIPIAVIAVAMLLSAGACLGDGESTDVAAPSPLVFRPATTTPNPTPAVVPYTTTRRPCPSESGGSRPWIKVKDVTICLPTSFTVGIVERIDGPSEHIAYIIERGNSGVRIDAHTGEIVEWNVDPETDGRWGRLLTEATLHLVFDELAQSRLPFDPPFPWDSWRKGMKKSRHRLMQ